MSPEPPSPSILPELFVIEWRERGWGHCVYSSLSCSAKYNFIKTRSVFNKINARDA